MPEDKRTGFYFEGPAQGKVIREWSLGNYVYGETPAARIEYALENHIPYAQDQMRLFEEHGIRTVRPKYLLAQREVTYEDDSTRVEDIVSIIADRIDGAIGFDSVLAARLPQYLQAYDDLALRLIDLLMDRYSAGAIVEPDYAHLEQYVIDPSATNLRDMTVLVDVEPYEDAYRSKELIRERIAGSLATLSKDIMRLVEAYGATDIESLPAIIAAIEMMPTVDSWGRDIKQPLLAALRTHDIETIDILLDEEDDYELE